MQIITPQISPRSVDNGRPSLSRTKGESTTALAQLEREQLENIEIDTHEHLDVLSKSLREISADLAGLSSQKTKGQSRDQLPLSLKSMSMHGELVAKRRKKPDQALTAFLSKTTHRASMNTERSTRGPRFGSVHTSRTRPSGSRADEESCADSCETRSQGGNFLPYFEKLCWVCERLGYPYEYADIVGSQFLGLEGASSVTHVDGHIPTMDELVEFLALGFICLADFADMIVLFIDDFQWVDSFSWKIFRVLCKRSKKMLMICAMRSHDKQALRRLSTAANGQREIQNQMIEITVFPLDPSEIQLLMSVVLGYPEKAIPESLCTDVFQRTGGLPVYVVQMLENMKRKKTIEMGKDGILKWNAAGLKEKVSNRTTNRYG